MLGHKSSPSLEYVTLRQAVDLGYAGYSTLRKHIAEGRLPASRNGRSYRLRITDLDKLAAPDSKSIDAAIERVVAAAPSLTDDQLRRIGSLLHAPGGVA